MSAQPAAFIASQPRRTVERPAKLYSMKLSRDLRGIPVDKYRLPTDGRKWKGAALQRMQLAEWLSTFGDSDGSRIYPSVRTMCDHFGLSRATIFRLLADLKHLGLLEDEKNEKGKSRLAGERGTRIRRMNVLAFLGCAPQPGANADSANVVPAPFEAVAGVSDSNAGVSDSRAGVSPSRDTTVTYTVTNQNQNLQPLTRLNSTAPCGKLGSKKAATPQQRNFGIVRRLTQAAVEILEKNPGISYADLSADLKQWAADNYLPIDTLPGAASPIVQAIDNAFKKVAEKTSSALDVRSEACR